MIGYVAPLPLYKLLVFRVFFGLHSVADSSLIGVHDRVLVSVREWLRNSSFPTLSCQLVL